MKPNRFISIICVALAGLVCGSAIFAQQKRAFLVGISDYGNPREEPDKWGNISGANDVAKLTPALQNQGFNVTTLIDSNATYKNITQGINKLTKQCKSGDIVYLHFSMHGQPVEDRNGDEADGWDEALIPYDAQMQFKKDVYEGQNHLLDDELEGILAKIRKKIGPKGQLYVVMDACHSGTMNRGDGDHVRGVRSGFTSNPEKLYTPDRSQETNGYYKLPTKAGQSPVTIMEACRSYQVNKEIRDAKTDTWYGSLSYYVYEALQSHSIDGSADWIEVVKKCMSEDRRLRKQNMVIESSK